MNDWHPLRFLGALRAIDEEAARERDRATPGLAQPAVVLCTVSALGTAMPCTPWQASTCRSSCRPAPPVGSEPATVRTRGAASLKPAAAPSG